MLFFIPITFLIAPVLTGDGIITTEQITATTSSPSSSDNNEELLDVQNHPNLGLLSTECGFISSKLKGETETLQNEMPWMVLLSYNTLQGHRLGCVGTLINKRYVLTAAQCVIFLGNNTLDDAVLGEYDVRADPDCSTAEKDPYCNPKVQIVTIEEVIPHPGYSLGGSRQAFADDIALVRLATPADFSNGTVGSLCLPVTPALQNEPLTGSLDGLVAGWNLNGFKLLSPVLQKHSVSTISNEECQLAYNNGTISNPPLITSKHVCIKSHDGGDDPGGPLMFPGPRDSDQRYIQQGIVSFGPTKRGSKLPEVYTRVTPYVKWILDNIKE